MREKDKSISTDHPKNYWKVLNPLKGIDRKAKIQQKNCLIRNTNLQ